LYFSGGDQAQKLFAIEAETVCDFSVAPKIVYGLNFLNSKYPVKTFVVFFCRKDLNATYLYRLQFLMKADNTSEFMMSRKNYLNFLLIRHPIHRHIFHLQTSVI
jgi:hypothetical protein